MRELKSEEVKNAIAKRLLEIAPECAVYKEAVTNVAYPHFFVHQVSVKDEEERKNKHILSFTFDVRYRIVSDVSSDLRLEQNIENMALRLLSSFNIIDMGDDKIRCSNKRYEKVDGVLHFMFEVNLLVADVNEREPSIKQEKLTVTEVLK